MEAAEDFMNNKMYDGVLGVADVLAVSGPVARNCTRSVDEMMGHVNNYIYSFDGFQSWITQVSSNVMGHFAQISLITSGIVSELNEKHSNYTRVSELTGELVFYTFTPNVTSPNLKYRRGDPLAPAPMNEVIWVTLESIYEFLSATQLVKENVIADCQGNILNMALFQSDAMNNFHADNLEESLFLTLDSFVFLRPTIEDCTVAGQQTYQNATVVFERIKKDPHTIRENFENNVFHVVSGSIATYAQIYHRDMISLSRVFGGVVYRTLVTITA
jgi:hypothetical protein